MTTTTVAEQLVQDARAWCGECAWADILEPSEIDDAPADAVLRAVEKHYDGGLLQFITDGATFRELGIRAQMARAQNDWRMAELHAAAALARHA